jgi:hypothetical protein
VIAITKNLDSPRQPQKYLPGVESHRLRTRGVDQATLKPTFRKLYLHQPIKHPTGTIEKIVIAAPEPLINKTANNVSRGFWV